MVCLPVWGLEHPSLAIVVVKVDLMSTLLGEFLHRHPAETGG
jgi:hypothetical protein